MEEGKRDRIMARQPTRAMILSASLLILLLCFHAAPAWSGQVNINHADLAQLRSLPFIGTLRAQAIIDHRQRHGPFQRIDDLLLVPTMGPRSLEAVRPHIRLVDTAKETAARKGPDPAHNRTILLIDHHYFDVLVNFIRSAEQRIDLAMFLFKTTDSPRNRPAKLVQELIRASKRGVKVVVVLEKSGYNDSINMDNQRVAATLRENNITVRLDSPGKTTHTKMVIIDDRFCFVGSHNFSHSALAYNHEVSLLLDNPVIAGQLGSYLAAIK